MGTVKAFLSRRSGKKRVDFSDVISYTYLILGVVVMFGPIIWLVLSSFKTAGEIVKFPPRLLPYRQETVLVEGYEEPLPLYNITMEDGSVQTLAQVRRIGLEAQLVDPANPGEIIKANINTREPVEKISFGLDNYIEGIESFNFGQYLWNSIVVTTVATLLTLLVNSMAAFALEQVQIQGAPGDFHGDDQYADGAAFGGAGAGFPGDHQCGLEQQPAGDHRACGGHADRCVPAAAVYAHHPR